MAKETEQAQQCAQHGDTPVPSECLLCELAQGERIAARIAAVMREEGLDQPADQFGVLLGLGVAGFARGGTSREVVLAAVEEAYSKAAAPSPG